MEQEQLTLTETEREIIIAYRNMEWTQSAIRKILDVKDPEERPRKLLIDYGKFWDAKAQGRTQ